MRLTALQAASLCRLPLDGFGFAEPLPLMPAVTVLCASRSSSQSNGFQGDREGRAGKDRSGTLIPEWGPCGLRTAQALHGAWRKRPPGSRCGPRNPHAQ